MLRLDAERSVSFCDGWTRRDFLHAGSLSLLGLGLPQWQALRAPLSQERYPQPAATGEATTSCPSMQPLSPKSGWPNSWRVTGVAGNEGARTAPTQPRDTYIKICYFHQALKLHYMISSNCYKSYIYIACRSLDEYHYIKFGN